MIIKSPEEMINLGQQIGKEHKKVLLYGDLGAGKTHFCKGFAQAIGINSNLVQSPTYTYINVYSDTLIHIDMYRLQEENEFIEKGILDEMNNYDYVLIEWPKFEDLYINNDYIAIHIDKIDPETRKVEIK